MNPKHSEKDVRPTRRPKHQGRTENDGKAVHPHHTRQEWRSPYSLTYGMTVKELIGMVAVCLLIVIFGFALLYIFSFAMNCVMKGWW